MAARAEMSPRHVLWMRRRGLHLAFVAVEKLAVIGEKKKKGQSCGSARQDQEQTASSLFQKHFFFLFLVIFIFWSKQIVHVRLHLWSCLQSALELLCWYHFSSLIPVTSY